MRILSFLFGQSFFDSTVFMALNNSTVIVADRYAVGLTWRAIASRGKRSDVALQLAQQDKAKYFVHVGDAPFLGLARLNRRLSKKKSFFALAGMAAKAYPGFSAFVLALPKNEGWWIGLSSNGQPSFDCLIRDRHEAIEKLDFLLEETRKSLSGSINSVTLYGDEGLGFENCLPLHIEQLQGFETSETQLRDATKSLPALVYLIALAAVLYLGYSQLWPMLVSRREALSPVPTKPLVDAVAEWTAAIQQWSKTVVKPIGTDLAPLRFAINGFPSTVGGWKLEGVSCVYGRVWVCTLAYKRPVGLESDATNRSFEDVRRSDWKVSWKSATEVSAIAEVIASVATPLLFASHVKALDYYQVDTFSEFQTLSKIFAKVSVSELARAEVVAPKTPEGQSIPRPDPKSFDDVLRADVVFTGPIRNLEIIELSKAPVFWREVSFSRTPMEKPTLQNSEFTATYRGDVYVKAR